MSLTKLEGGVYIVNDKTESAAMGRPPIGKRAMSGAERQRRYLDRLLRGAKPTPDTAKLQARIRELEAQLAQTKKELARAKARIAESTE
jgi:hypothetical protein